MTLTHLQFDIIIILTFVGGITIGYVIGNIRPKSNTIK